MITMMFADCTTINPHLRLYHQHSPQIVPATLTSDYITNIHLRLYHQHTNCTHSAKIHPQKHIRLIIITFASGKSTETSTFLRPILLLNLLCCCPVERVIICNSLPDLSHKFGLKANILLQTRTWQLLVSNALALVGVELPQNWISYVGLSGNKRSLSLAKAIFSRTWYRQFCSEIFRNSFVCDGWSQQDLEWSSYQFLV